MKTITNLPDIILIVCDTLAAKRMSIYGHTHYTTPNMEKLCDKEGFTLFKYCFSSSPWTIPSHASLFSGLYPSQHKVTGETYESCIFRKDLVSLPLILNLSSYKTFAISSNPIISQETGFNVGFQYFLNLPKKFSINKNPLDIQTRISERKLWEEFKKDVKNPLFNKRHEIFLDCLFALKNFKKSVTQYSFPYTQKTLELATRIWKNIDKPIFIFLNLMENHDKYIPPPSYRNKFGKYSNNEMLQQKWWKHYYEKNMSQREIEVARILYDEEVFTVDELIYKFICKLKKIDKNRFDNAIIIITSDHGEALGEWSHWGHMFSVYPETIRIPLIIKFPKNSISKGEFNNLVMLQDVYSTLLEIVNPSFPHPTGSVSILSKDRQYILVQNYWSKWCDLQKGLKKDHFMAFITYSKFSQEFYYLVEHEMKKNWFIFRTKDLFNLFPVEDRQLKEDIKKKYLEIKNAI